MTNFSSCIGKVVVITGSGSGMGKAMAKTFAENGMKVVVADFNSEAGMKVVEDIKAVGNEASFIQVDVSKEEDVKKMVDFAVETYGKLDGIVNNAGIGYPETPIHETPMEYYDRVSGVDQRGVFLGIKYGAEAILKSKNGGFIINTSSNGGFQGTEGMAIYTMSKAAVINLTKTAALEYAKHNIRVNAICPGTTKTEIWGMAPQEYIDSFCKNVPMGRLAEPQEIANTALFLASDLAPYLTGTTITFDCGSNSGYIRNVAWKNPEIDK
ncbi:MAG: SDR family oxidoreductase [Erysipelotrichaceae bacterium]|nr:SDR family oxidoreductase [Erysipelotrichaceae bacterium]